MCVWGGGGRVITVFHLREGNDPRFELLGGLKK